MYKAVAKTSFSVDKTNGRESSFTKDKEYDCVKRSNGDFVIMDNQRSALQLEEKDALDNFWIKGN